MDSGADCRAVLISSLAPRPQMLTYLCFALYLAALLAFKYAGKIRPLFALPLVMVVWVNGHAGYAIGIALLVLFAVCEWLGWLAQPVRDPAHKRRLLRLTQRPAWSCWPAWPTPACSSAGCTRSRCWG